VRENTLSACAVFEMMSKKGRGTSTGVRDCVLIVRTVTTGCDVSPFRGLSTR